MKYNGLEVIIDDSLAEYDRVNRSWRERLLSWTPWRAYRMIPKPPPYIVYEGRRAIFTTSTGAFELWRQAQWQSEDGERATGFLDGLQLRRTTDSILNKGPTP